MFTISQVAASTPYDDSVTLLGGDNVQDAIGLLAGLVSGFASEQYVADAASNLLPFYLYSDASDVATYLVMKEGIPSGGGFGIPISAASDGDLFAAFVSEPGIPGITAIPSGVYKLRAQARKSAGTKTAKIYFEIYKRDLGGVETLLGTSSDSSVLTGSDAEQICDIVFGSPIAFLSTDRIVVKVLVRVSGAGTAPDVTVDIQGVNFSRFEWPANVLDSAKSYADSLAANLWNLAGNAGTAGTAVVGTTDAQPWTTIAGGVYVDSYAIDGSVSSILNFTQPDGTNFDQKRNQVNLTASVPITSGNFTNSRNSVGYASPFNYVGSISSVSGYVDLGTPNTVNFSSVSENGMYLHGGGTIDLVKGVNMNAGVESGTTVNSYSGIFSSINSTGGIFGGVSLFSSGSGFTDIQSGNITGYGTNIDVNGASVLSQGIQGFSAFLQVRDTTTVAQNIQGAVGGITVSGTAQANGGMVGYNLNIQVNDDATSNHVNGIETDIAVNQNAVVQGVTMHQINFQVNDAGNAQFVTGLNNGFAMSGTSHVDGYQAFNPSIQIAGSPTISNALTLYSGGANVTGSPTMNSFYGISTPLNIKDSSVVTGQFEGQFLSMFLQNTATANDMIGIDLSMHVDDTASVANQIAGLKISIQTNTPHNGNSLRGLEINMSGASLSAAKLAAGAQVVGLAIYGGAFQTSYDYTVPGSTFFTQVNNIGGTLRVAAGDPVTNALAFGNNFAVNLAFDDDWGPDFTGLRIGPVINGAVGSIQGAAGKTVDTVTLHLAAMPNLSGAGTVDQVIAYRAAGILPSGGSLTVNNAYGFLAMGTLGTLVPSGNVWAFYDDSAALGGDGAENYLSKLVLGAGGSKKVASSSVALEIQAPRAFVNGRGDTATRLALTALAGMQFYDTDLNQLLWYNGTAWVVASGSYTPPTEEQEELTTAIDPGNVYDLVNVTFVLSQTPTSNKCVKLYLDGQIQYQGTDYTISGNTITMVAAPSPTQSLYADYTY